MIVDRLKMARKLFENPKLKAYNNYGGAVYVRHGNEKDYSKNDKCLVWINQKYVDMCIVEGETWEIAEPKLKEFCFGEFYYLWNTEALSTNNIKSCVTGLSYARTFSQITLAEFKGKWTIEGYFEDGESGKSE